MKITIICGTPWPCQGTLAEADSLLTEVLKSVTNPDQRGLALAFRGMARWRVGRADEARADLAEVEKLTPPDAEGARFSEFQSNPDPLAVRLALREAKTLLNKTPPTPQ